MLRVPSPATLWGRAFLRRLEGRSSPRPPGRAARAWAWVGGPGPGVCPLLHGAQGSCPTWRRAPCGLCVSREPRSCERACRRCRSPPRFPGLAHCPSPTPPGLAHGCWPDRPRGPPPSPGSVLAVDHRQHLAKVPEPTGQLVSVQESLGLLSQSPSAVVLLPPNPACRPRDEHFTDTLVSSRQSIVGKFQIADYISEVSHPASHSRSCRDPWVAQRLRVCLRPRA